MKEKIIKALVGSPGVVTGVLTKFREEQVTTVSDSAGSIEQEEKLWRKAEAAATRELKEQRKHLKEANGHEANEAVSVINSHLLAIHDPIVQQGIKEKIHIEQISAARAVFEVFEQLIRSFKKLPETLFQEKARDIEDIRARLLKWFSRRKKSPVSSVTKIIFAESVRPGQVLQLVKKGVKGIIVRNSSSTSHELIIARALSIPLLYHPKAEFDIPPQGVPALLDADKGQLVLNPSLQHSVSVIMGDIAAAAPKSQTQSHTKQQKKLQLYLNLSVPQELPLAKQMDALGVGLFRSELPFLGNAKLPSFHQQVAVYKAMMAPFKDKPFSFRLFDFSPDKEISKPQSDSLSQIRSIRRLLLKPKLLETQLKAILAANDEASTKLTILIPFVSLIEEIMAVKNMLAALKATANDYKLAAMIETPAACEMIPFFNDLVHSYSVGTNDLLQLVTATPRGDDRQQKYGDPLQEGSLVTLEKIIKLAGTKKVTICGELPTQPGWLSLLAAMGYHNFSVSVGRYHEVAAMAQYVDLERAAQYLKKIHKLPTLAKRRELFKTL